MSRICDAFKCGSTVPVGRFLCSHHWRMVPAATQGTINAQYRAGRKDFAFLSDAIYLQACVDAIDAIAAREGQDVVPTTYHRLLTAAKRKTDGAQP